MKFSNFSKNKLGAYLSIGVLLAACGGGGGGGSRSAAPTPPPAGITVTGSVLDGPVTGGTLFAFTANTIGNAMSAAEGASDRASALNGAGPIASQNRDPAGDASFSLTIPGERAGEVLFLVFDSSGSQDETFSDEPFNLEAVGTLGAAGSTNQLNLNPHTTLATMQVRAMLDPDGDGNIVSQAEIETAATNAISSVVSALDENEFGESLLNGADPVNGDLVNLVDAATYVGRLVRRAAALADTDRNEVVALLAADAADGALDGSAPASYPVDDEARDTLAEINDLNELGGADELDGQMVSCSASARQMRRACEFEVLDDFFVAKAVCADTSSLDDFIECSGELAEERSEDLEECDDITEARLELCDDLDDAPYDPAFGPEFAANFVDPLQIGTTVAPNPYLPLVVGNQWVYEGTSEDDDGEIVVETVTIDVLPRTKFVDGVTCLVVRDVVVIDGLLVESTDDWFAQDIDGNVWYCGEESKDYEFFEGDDPQLAELIHIDGSFKAGRDGDKAGILIPAVPIVGDIFRQEVSYGNAEDVIEITATDGSFTAPAASCAGTCLVTRDFTPLEPDEEEEKYYLPGVGKLAEIDLEEDEQVVLISTNVTP